MDVLFDEIDSLEAILMEDVKIIKNEITNFPELIETTVLPIVGEDVERQYVCVTLQVMPIEGYPDISPQFKLKNPRGLDDNSLNLIEKSVKDKLKESIGLPVVFDLIDVVREHLTSSNLPSGQCVICLYGFKEGDNFTKTECYHFLHTFCLARHLIASKKNYQEEQDKLPAWQQKLSKPFQSVCPVCREVISDDEEPLLNAPPPSELENAPKFQLTNDLKNLQMKMSDLFLHQKQRGGIIDLDAVDHNILSLENDEDNDSDRKNNVGNDDEVEKTNGEVLNNTATGQAPQQPILHNSQQHNNSRHHHHSNHHTHNRHNYHHHHHNQHGYNHHRGNHFRSGIGGGGGSIGSVQGNNNSGTGNRNQSNDNLQNSANIPNTHNSGYSNRNYNRHRRGVHHTQNNTQQPCSSNPR